MILAGHGIMIVECDANCASWPNDGRIPVALTLLGKGAMPEKPPAGAGHDGDARRGRHANLRHSGSGSADRASGCALMTA
jgi:hypothetical protein